MRNDLSEKDIFVGVVYLLAELHGTQFGRLGPGVHHDIEHGAYGLRHTKVCSAWTLLQLHLKGCSGSETTQGRPNSNWLALVIQNRVQNNKTKYVPVIQSFCVILSVAAAILSGTINTAKILTRAGILAFEMTKM